MAECKDCVPAPMSLPCSGPLSSVFCPDCMNLVMDRAAVDAAPERYCPSCGWSNPFDIGAVIWTKNYHPPPAVPSTTWASLDVALPILDNIACPQCKQTPGVRVQELDSDRLFNSYTCLGCSATWTN